MATTDNIRSPIGVAVIGAGHWGPNLIRNFENPPHSRVIAVVDRDQGRRAQVGQRFAQIRVTDAAEGVFSDPAVQAVVIATPTSTHFGLARAALQAGKHVLVEKPITASAAEADELVALAATRQRVLMVGHVFIYNQAVQRVRAIIESGDLGRLYHISMVRTNLGPIRMDVNAAWDLAAHDISIANHWLQATPESVSAVGGVWINPGIEDAVFATLRYPGNVLVNVHASWLNPRKSRDITVAGDKRMLTFDDMNMLEPLRIYDKGVTDTVTRPGFVDTFAAFRASVREGEITIPKVSSGEPLRAECDHFLECIRSSRAPMTDGAFGAAVVRTLAAVARSVKTGGAQEKV